MWLVRVGQGLLGLAALAASQLAGMDLPPGFWDDRQWLIYVAVGVLALSAGAEPLWEAVLVRWRRHRELRQRDIDTILRATLLRLDDAGLDWREIGIDAFCVSHRLPFWEQRLTRVGRLRMIQRPASEPKVRWTRGKGVIGRCWATRRYVVVNVAALYREHAEASPHEWNAKPAEERLGMTYGEVQATRDYAAIAACPILDPDGRFHGCVAVDAPEGNYKRLRDPAVQQAMQDACTSLWALTRARGGLLPVWP
jgi:hypothetical protein